MGLYVSMRTGLANKIIVIPDNDQVYTWRDTAIESDQAYIFPFGRKLKVPRMERLRATDYVDFARESDRHVVGVLREAVNAPMGQPEILK